MSFSDRAKLTAFAIVHVFETSRPFGDYAAVAVLNDGAGVSYGVSQFTHRAGSLYKVVNTYLGMGGTVGAAVLRDRMHVLMDSGTHAIQQLANDRQFKDALRFAGETDEMKLAQSQIAENFYMLPAINACEGSGFTCPLSLAVVYDSINHGSFGAIRDRVPANLPEKQWITEYVRRRHEWLRSKPRLKATSYRTAFFLDEIRDGNWELDLPIYPHGTEINDAMFPEDADATSAGENHPVGETPPPLLCKEGSLDSAVEPVNNEPASEDPADADMVMSRDAATTAASDPAVLAQPPTPFADMTPPESFVQRVQTTITTKLTTFTTFIGGLGVLGTALMDKVQDFASRNVAIIVGVALLVLAVWYLKDRQDKAHALQLALVQTAADPNRSTVRVK